MKQKLSRRFAINWEPPHVISSQDRNAVQFRVSFCCLFIKYMRNDMCGDLPTSFSGYVIFEGLWMFFGKLQNVEFGNNSTIYCSWYFV